MLDAYCQLTESQPSCDLDNTYLASADHEIYHYRNLQRMKRQCFLQNSDSKKV